MNRFALLLLTLALLGFGAACESRSPAARGSDASVEWEQVVRNAHGLADSAQSESQRTQAILALRGALRAAPRPVNARLQWVVQDLHFRLAQALADNQDLTAAQAVIDQGLAVASEPSVARANLLALQGKVYEGQGKPEQAARALHDALLINEVLFERALDGEVERERR